MQENQNIYVEKNATNSYVEEKKYKKLIKLNNFGRVKDVNTKFSLTIQLEFYPNDTLQIIIQIGASIFSMKNYGKTTVNNLP